ncbi:MAG: FlgD immunoglobulin-like domain containing protein [Candidatus Eisenbacteria bacterium]
MRLFATTPFLLALALTMPATASGAVRVALSPDTLAVTPGATFSLAIEVPVPGSAFNGYDAVVEYDRTRLTYLPTSPYTLQEGVSMRSACGNTFFVVSAAGDSIAVSHVLLCAGVTLTGPSQLCVLRFRASNAAVGATWVKLRRVQFYSEGLFVNPAVSSDALVHWGGALDVPSSTSTLGIRMVVGNNPSRDEQRIELASAVAGWQELTIFDLAGRAVRRLDAGERPAGARSVSWDGRDDSRRAVPAGVYRARFTSASRSAFASLVRLP